MDYKIQKNIFTLSGISNLNGNTESTKVYDAFEKFTKHALTTNHTECILDISCVTLAESSTLGEVIKMYSELKSAGKKLIVQLSQKTKNVWHLTGMDQKSLWLLNKKGRVVTLPFSNVKFIDRDS